MEASPCLDDPCGMTVPAQRVMSRTGLVLAPLLAIAIALPGCAAVVAVPAIGSAAASGGASALARAATTAVQDGTVYRTFDRAANQRPWRRGDDARPPRVPYAGRARAARAHHPVGKRDRAAPCVSTCSRSRRRLRRSRSPSRSASGKRIRATAATLFFDLVTENSRARAEDLVTAVAMRSGPVLPRH